MLAPRLVAGNALELTPFLSGSPPSFHQTLAFSGFKLLPPSLHLAVFAPPHAAASPSPIPAPRTGLLFFSEPQQVVARAWSRPLESLAAVAAGPTDVVSREVLKTLDKELAPYPFDLWPDWKPLFDGLTKRSIEAVLGPGGEGPGSWDLDGFEIGEEEELAGGADALSSLAAERVLRHRAEREGKPFDASGRPAAVGGERRHRWAQFDVRKSWRAGALGEEVSLFARDKSWLFWNVVDGQCGGGESCVVSPKDLADADLSASFVCARLADPHQLLTQLALLVPLGVQLQAPALLVNTYRRLLTLVSQAHIHLDPVASGQHFPPASPERTLQLATFHLALVKLVHAQVAWLPPDFFATELPETEGWWKAALLDDLVAGVVRPSEAHASHFDGPTNAAWQETRTRSAALQQLLADKYGWTQEVRGVAGNGSDDEEEDDEDRPMMVENRDHYVL